MIKHTRQEARALGLPRCFGSACAKHPEMEGERYVSGACVVCSKEYVCAGRLKNPDKIQAQRKISNAKLAEKRKTDPDLRAQKLAYDKWYRATHKNLVAQGKRDWALKNPGATSAFATLRKHAKNQRTPHWLTKDDLWLMREAHALATLRTKMLGYAWEVDHIIPLQGELVSGLHVPTNLQVIPRSQNRAKWNTFQVT
jgi:5-methylcytosine-specific restriction endonuclease McrA